MTRGMERSLRHGLGRARAVYGDVAIGGLTTSSPSMFGLPLLSGGVIEFIGFHDPFPA